ncbi:MAG TPA: hypothetical protein DEP72_04585 [Clostridiales bacterium]|nr:MAG: hypothetical protein A2Y18_05380 [Clostridiales bacterium GWD2_32_19]HCC07419.1 hypothetical protein [Clostridiales bacterium]
MLHIKTSVNGEKKPNIVNENSGCRECQTSGIVGDQVCVNDMDYYSDAPYMFAEQIHGPIILEQL